MVRLSQGGLSLSLDVRQNGKKRIVVFAVDVPTPPKNLLYAFLSARGKVM
jgi:hypothetical protein